MAVPRLESPIMAYYYYPETRVLQLAQSINVATHRWEESLVRARGAQVIDRAARRTRNDANRVFGYNKINLDEILQAHFDVSDPTTAMHLDSILDSPDALPEDHDVYFEIPIDINESIFGSRNQNSRQQLPPEEINVVAFSQIDIRALHEEFGIDPVDSGLSQIGGNLIFEKCLERSEGSYLGMRVPEKRKIFTLPDGRTYSGPVHYHPDIDGQRGPSGYVGYMAGPAGGDMSIRDTLSVREVPNSKIVAKILTDSALNAEGQLLSENNSFNGFGNDTSFEAEDYGMLSLGDHILSALRSQYGTIISSSPEIAIRDKNERLKHLCVASLRKGKLNITHSFENLSPTELSWINIAGTRPYHGSLFALDLSNLLRYNSEYGYIIERHATSNRDNPNPSVRPAIQKSDSLLQNFVNLSRIYSMRITRERVTNHPLGNNLVSTPDYEKLNEDQVAKDMVDTNSPARNAQGIVQNGSVIVTARNNNCEISERDPSLSTLRKLFFVKDYDLFDRHSFGNYEYKLDLKIHDGLLLYMKRELTKLRRSISNYEVYVEEASRPYIDPTMSSYYNGSSIQTSREQGRAKGNYNHSTKRFTPSFILRSQQLRDRSDKVVDAYVDSYFLLTASPAFTVGQKNQIKRSLLAENATLEFLEFFLSLCKKLENRFETILGLSGIEEREVFALDSNPKSISSSNQTPKSIIHLNGSTNIVAKAVSKNSVFARPLPVNEIDRSIQLQNPAVSFFGLSNSSINSGQIASSNRYTVQELAIISQDLSAAENNDSATAVGAAVNSSQFGGALSVEGQSYIKDRYKEIDNLLSTYKNTTFRTLVSNASEPIEKESDTEGQDKKFINIETQQAILGSILAADNRKIFEEEAEKQYKDFYFSKKSLGGLYSTVKESLTNHELINNSKNQQAPTYKEKVQTNTTTTKDKAQSSSKYQKSLEDKNAPVTSYNLEEPGVNTNFIIHKIDNSLYEGVVLVNNVEFVERSTAQNERTSGRIKETTQTTQTTQTNQGTPEISPSRPPSGGGGRSY